MTSKLPERKVGVVEERLKLEIARESTWNVGGLRIIKDVKMRATGTKKIAQTAKVTR